jgi:hypothetical protein
MVQTRSIDSVIKKVNSSYPVQGDNEAILMVHRERREIIERPWFWQSVDYYLVSFSSSAECKNLTYRVSDLASGGFIDLSIDYRVSCSPENARQVVLALHGDSPQEELEKKIKFLIDRQIEGNTYRYVSDINACFSGIWQIQQELAQKVRTEIGLTFSSRISITGVSQFRPFTIEFNGLNCSISDFSSRRELTITIDYRATCDSSSIAQAVSALYGSDRPVNVLNEKIKEWVDKFSEGRAAQIIDNFDIESGNLRTNLREKARQEVGLNLEIRISSNNFKQVRREGSEQLKPFSTGILPLSIRVADYDQELELQLEAILDIDPNNRDKAFSNRGREFSLLIPIIGEEVKRYCLQNTSLHKFVTDLQYSVRQGIEDSLNRALADKGRKIAYLSLSSKSIDEIKERLCIRPYLEIQNYQVECPLLDIKEPIRVNNLIHLQLVDLSRYRTAVANKIIPLNADSTPDLEKWIKGSLEQAINLILPKETFSNLLLEFEPIVSEKVKADGSLVKAEDERTAYSSKLLQALEAASEKIGYAVTRLVSEPDLQVRERLGLREYEFLNINDYIISCTVKGYDKPIDVKNTLHLQIVNVWQYSNAVKTKQVPLDDETGKPNLEKWAKQNLEKIVKPLLLNTEFVDLIPESGTDNYTQEVFKQIHKSASLIGYEVTQIITIPELEEIRKHREIFSVETGEREYPTKDAHCPVKLDTTVDMRIDDLQGIGHRLRSSEIALQTQIKNRTIEAISRIMNGIEPERFFMRFDSYDAKVRGETKSVEQELNEAIEQELKESFKAVVISITLKIVDTDLLKLFKSLQGRNDNFQVEFQPTSGDVEKVTFIGKFQVLSVAGTDWNKFQTKFRNALNKREKLLEVVEELEQQRMELEKQGANSDQKEIKTLNEKIEALEAEACGIKLIREHIESDFQRIVRRRKGDEFRYSRIEDLNHLEEALNKWLKEGRGSIKDMYGLEVEVSQLDCPITESEESRADKQHSIEMLKRQRMHKQQQIEKLEQKLLELTDQFGTSAVDEEIEKVEARVEKLYSDIQKISGQLEGEENKLKGSLEPQQPPIGLFKSIPTHRNYLEEEQKEVQQTESQSEQSQAVSDSPSPGGEAEAFTTVETNAQVVDNDIGEPAANN